MQYIVDEDENPEDCNYPAEEGEDHDDEENPYFDHVQVHVNNARHDTNPFCFYSYPESHDSGQGFLLSIVNDLGCYIKTPENRTFIPEPEMRPDCGLTIFYNYKIHKRHGRCSVVITNYGPDITKMSIEGREVFLPCLEDSNPSLIFNVPDNIDIYTFCFSVTKEWSRDHVITINRHL